MKNEEQEKKLRKNKKINKMSRNALKKKARELVKAGQLGSQYYEQILARLEGRATDSVK